MPKNAQNDDVKELLSGFKEASLDFLKKYENILNRIDAVRAKQFSLLKKASEELDQYKLAKTKKQFSK